MYVRSGLSVFSPFELQSNISILCINSYYYIFFPLNGTFDTELVHLYLNGRVQMSIKYHYDPEFLSNKISRGCKHNHAYTAPPGV